MINMLQSEHLKYKKTFSKMLVFIAPIYVLAYSLFMNQYFFETSINWWCIIILPFTIAIVAATSANREKKAGQYRTLKSKDINLKKMWISKIIVIGCYTFITSLVIIGYFLIVKLIFSSNLIEIRKLIIGIFTIWFTTLILIPICLFFAEKFGAFGAIAVILILSLVEVYMTTQKIWYLSPMSISNRLMCPILNLNPNGMLLEAGDPLLDSSVIPIGFIVAAIGFVILSILTSLWFAKKEAH